MQGERAWLQPLRDELGRRRRRVFDFLSASRHLETAADSSRGAMFVLLRPRAFPLTDSLATALDVIEQTGVALVPGAAFGRCGEGWLRLSFATADGAELEAALETLERYFAAPRAPLVAAHRP